ncbi:MAG: hypothetical protein V4722_00515 [Bacteroidota bacterium]
MNILSGILPKKRYEFIEDIKGVHQLGGDIPAGFIMPPNDFIGSIQYLGAIDNSDTVFSWLPFRLHLICPIFLNIEMVFVDYENPNAPVIISPLDTAAVTTEYDDLEKDSIVIFNKISVGLELIKVPITEDNDDEIIGLTGKPVWEQNSESPKCPKTGRKMKFICQLFSSGKVTTKYTNIKAAEQYYQDCFADMNFWEDGSLYVFFEPDSKVACYFIQHT